MTQPHKPLREHHQAAIDYLAASMQKNPDCLAVIISGSVAKGLDRADSDIDCYLVMTDDAYRTRLEQDDTFYYTTEGCNYEGGYYDGKIVPYSFIQAAAVRGSEPTRASFEGAFVVYSLIPDLAELVSQISVYPEHNRLKNFADFYAQVALYGGYFAERALALNNTYLLAHSISQVALFGGRLMLAYNRQLFPCHKSLNQSLSKLAHIPADYMELQDAMLAHPNQETIGAFVASIRTFHDWGIAEEKTISRFVENNEWNWLTSEPPLSDR